MANQPTGLPPEKDFWDAGAMLDSYILDYLKRRDLQQTANTFKLEAKMPDRPPVFDAPNGFLLEWWLVFWEVYLARTNPSYSEAASHYLEVHKKAGAQPQSGYPMSQYQMMQQGRSFELLDQQRDWRLQQLQREQMLRQQHQMAENEKLSALLKQQQSAAPGLSGAMGMERAGSLLAAGHPNPRQFLHAAMANQMQGGLGQALPPQLQQQLSDKGIGLGGPAWGGPGGAPGPGGGNALLNQLTGANLARAGSGRPELQQMARLQAAAAAAAGPGAAGLGRLGSMANSDSMEGAYSDVGPSQQPLLNAWSLGGGPPANGVLSQQQQQHLLQQLQRQQANQFGMAYSPENMQHMGVDPAEARKQQQLQHILASKSAAVQGAQRASMSSPVPGQGQDHALLAATAQRAGSGSLAGGPMSAEQQKQLLTHHMITHNKRLREQAQAQQQQQQQGGPHMLAGAQLQQGQTGPLPQQLLLQASQQMPSQSGAPSPASQLNATRQTSWNVANGGSLPGPNGSGPPSQGPSENGSKPSKSAPGAKSNAASSRPRRGKAAAGGTPPTPSTNGPSQASSPHPHPTPSNGSGNSGQPPEALPTTNSWQMEGMAPTNSGGDGPLATLSSYGMDNGTMDNSNMMRPWDSMGGTGFEIDGFIHEGFDQDMDPFLGATLGDVAGTGALADSMLGGVAGVDAMMGLKRASDGQQHTDDKDSKRRKGS